MFKVKFRVYVDKHCKRCDIIHPHPTHRSISHVAEGTEHEVIQAGHKFAVALLEQEGDGARPLYQFSFPVERKHNAPGKTL